MSKNATQKCSPYLILGWAITEMCAMLDKGIDPRDVELPTIVEAMERDIPEVKTFNKEAA